jgi:DNA-binding MarR family transcriptional regulator
MTVAEFRAAFEHYVRAGKRIVGRYGLPPKRYALLLMIKGAPDGSERTTVTELSRRLELAQHTTTELVGRAVKAGLIRRTVSSEDRRVVHLTLSARGERQLLKAFNALAPERRAFRDMVVRTGANL